MQLSAPALQKRCDVQVTRCNADVPPICIVRIDAPVPRPSLGDAIVQAHHLEGCSISGRQLLTMHRYETLLMLGLRALKSLCKTHAHAHACLAVKAQAVSLTTSAPGCPCVPQKQVERT